MSKALQAGLYYFSIVFAIGFGLGTIRVLVLTPEFGEAISLIIELPIILVVSWVACKYLITRMNIPDGFQYRLTMGTSAFILLMSAEVILAIIVFGSSIEEHINKYSTVYGLFGFIGQCLFALLPLIINKRVITV